MDELAAQISSDLAYLRDTWNLPDIDDNFLRRDSAILRRLLIDNGGGMLRTVRKAQGHKGDIKVDAVDMKHYLDGLDRKAIVFASAGGATFGGGTLWGMFEYRAAMSPEQIARRNAQKDHLTRVIGLARYLAGTCIIVGGTSVSRANLIQYMANRFGGVHYDESRGHNSEAVARQFVALDNTGDYKLMGKPAIFFELLGIGQTLVKSPQVASMLGP